MHVQIHTEGFLKTFRSRSRPFGIIIEFPFPSRCGARELIEFPSRRRCGQKIILEFPFPSPRGARELIKFPSRRLPGRTTIPEEEEHIPGLAKGKMNKASLLFANSKFLKNFVFVNLGVLSRERKGEKTMSFQEQKL